MRVVLAGEPWLKDPLAIRKKWQEDEYQLIDHGGGKRLCFGILWNNGEVIPHPPVTRGLEITKQALIDAGHKGQVIFIVAVLLSLSDSTPRSNGLETPETFGNMLDSGKLVQAHDKHLAN